MDRLRAAMDFVGRVERAATLEELAAWFVSTVGLFGVRRWAVAVLGQRGALQPVRVLVANQDPEWVSRYIERRYDRIDPVADELLRRARPFFWGEVEHRSDEPAVAQLFGEVRETGVADGLVIPWHGADGELGCITLQGDRFDLSPQERATLRMVALYFAEVARELTEIKADETLDCPLTRRQLECLHWAAEGKSDWEIGQILSISEGTVSRHFDRIREKLNVVTRTQATVIAIRRRWLGAQWW